MNTTQQIHNDIEPWLVASVHDQLSADERTQLQEHLANCETCRALHAEGLATHNMIATILDEMKPDLAFEQRVLSGFRKKLPHRAGLFSVFGNLLRSRVAQVAAVAALLLTMVQVGRLVTGEDAASLGSVRTPVEGLRQIPSFVGQTSAENDNNSGDASGIAAQDAPRDAERENATGSSLPVRAAAKMPATTTKNGYSADAIGQFSEPLAALEPKAMAAPTSVAENRAARFRQEADKKDQTEVGRGSGAAAPPAPPDSNRKLVRNAQVELEVLAFDDAVQKITAFVTELRGYVATSSSAKQANGKLRGAVVVKVLPETLEACLAQLRGLGELKNQTLGTEDVTKQYFDTDSRLKNARIMEQRLLDILKTSSNKVADLLEVEKELGRVRASIEQMQGELKYMDALVAYATVTITLTEKDMDTPAAFLLKRRAQLALFSNDVEKTFAEAKTIADGAKAQISSSTLDRDGAGEATARLILLIVPEEADALIARIKGMGRVQNYNEQTERVAQGGSGMAEGAKVERDKVELSVTISRNEQEPPLQTTTLSILTSGVSEKVALLKEAAAKANGEIRSSTFNKNPDGQEYANVSLRIPMKNYAALMKSLDQLGKVKDVSVQRQDRRGTVNEETAPADINIQVYSQPSIVSDESGLFATIRRTLMQGVAALMWSLRMIGVAIAFFAPWVLAIVAVVWVTKRISRARKARRESNE